MARIFGPMVCPEIRSLQRGREKSEIRIREFENIARPRFFAISKMADGGGSAAE